LFDSTFFKYKVPSNYQYQSWQIKAITAAAVTVVSRTTMALRHSRVPTALLRQHMALLHHKPNLHTAVRVTLLHNINNKTRTLHRVNTSNIRHNSLLTAVSRHIQLTLQHHTPGITRVVLLTILLKANTNNHMATRRVRSVQMGRKVSVRH
jgi:hypothetical protein